MYIFCTFEIRNHLPSDRGNLCGANINQLSHTNVARFQFLQTVMGNLAFVLRSMPWVATIAHFHCHGVSVACANYPPK